MRRGARNDHPGAAVPLLRAPYRAGMFSEADARALATRLHAGQADRDGSAHIDHVARVAERATPERKVSAWLHDTIEDCAVTREDLLAAGVSAVDVQTVWLLSRLPSDGRTYMTYISDIAGAEGEPGRLARADKRDDLLDNLGRTPASEMQRGIGRRYTRALRVIEDAMVTLSELAENQRSRQYLT